MAYRRVASAFALGFAVVALSAGPALAQTTEQFAEEPTDGVFLPGVGITGTVDATTVARNPAGLSFVGGTALALAIDGADDDKATGAGPGVGLFMASSFGGKLLPKLSWGMGLEFLRPPRVRITPDPGTPTRLSVGTSIALGDMASFGTTYRRFFDSDSQPIDGVSTWDIGFHTRYNAYVASGFVVRDLFAPDVGSIPVQRRYELELAARPVGTDRLELALGGRFGETRHDLDGWLRWSAKLTRGIYFRGELETRALHVLETSITGTRELNQREYRLSAGFEFSIGGTGVTAYASGALDNNKDSRFRGATGIWRISTEQVPSLIPAPDRIEKIRLGAMSDRAHTALLLKLRAIGRDPHVVAVFLHFDGYAAGWAAAQELRNALLELRQKGKKIFAYMFVGGTRTYYVASAADKIYVDPAGGVRMAGFGGTSIYFKGLFDKLGINAQFEKIEEYKSAPESWTRTGPTEPAKRMRNELYDSLYEELIGGIAKSRKVTRARVRKMMDDGPYTAGDLQGKTKIVDAIAKPDEVSKLITKELGRAYPVTTAPKMRPKRWRYPEIAVIFLTGDIVDGESQNIPIPLPFIGGRLAGSKTIVQAIQQARENPNIKAIVLRIDSPGGSALASEKMSREVFKTRKVKPIICSMGNIAASGGYFAAAGCDVIFADPMTITGSIGIFYGKFDMSSMLSKIGLSWRTYTRGKRADMESYFRPYTPAERVFIKTRLRYMYGRFTKAVADGRNMTQAAVNNVGRGHVWTGAQARPIKLVDHFGSVADAIAFAKAKAGMGKDERARVTFLPKPKRGLLERLTSLPGLSTKQKAPATWLRLLPNGASLLKALPFSLLVQPNSAQMRLPFSFLWN